MVFIFARECVCALRLLSCIFDLFTSDAPWSVCTQFLVRLSMMCCCRCHRGWLGSSFSIFVVPFFFHFFFVVFRLCSLPSYRNGEQIKLKTIRCQQQKENRWRGRRSWERERERGRNGSKNAPLRSPFTIHHSNCHSIVYFFYLRHRKNFLGKRASIQPTQPCAGPRNLCSFMCAHLFFLLSERHTHEVYRIDDDPAYVCLLHNSRAKRTSNVQSQTV